jgi:uncharacterized protein
VPIKIDITPLLKSVGNKIRIDEQETVSYPEDGLDLTSPVKVEGEMVNAGRGILFEGLVSTRLKLNCSRCLKEIEVPLSFEMEEEFRRHRHESPDRKKERELKDDDFFSEISSDNTIDLSEALRQELLTELPIQPLCSEECKGV